MTGTKEGTRRKGSKFHAEFILPPKKNSAVAIIKPKTQCGPHAQSAEVVPSLELARAFSSDFQEKDASWPKVGAIASTSRHAVVFPSEDVAAGKDAREEPHTVETSGKAERPSSSRAMTSIEAQLAEVIIVRQELGQARNPPLLPLVSAQKQHIQPPKTIVAFPTPATTEPSTSARHTPIDSSNSALDVYAANYVPQYLRAINESPAQIRISTPLPIMNYAQYIASFAGFSFLRPLDYVQYDLVNPKELKQQIPANMLHEQAYGTHLKERLQLELGAQVAELQGLAMYNVSFDVSDQSQNLYRFIIPGIREDSPRIDLGDTILVRPWARITHDGLAEAAKNWFAAGGAKTGRYAPGFNGFEFRAVVWGLQKSREEVVLRLDGFLPNAIRICNLIFVLQDYRLASMYRAISHSEDQFHQAAPLTQQWMRSMLFPTTSDGVVQKKLSKASFDPPWYDHQLNFEQQKAVDAILRSEYGPVPFLISGPPGTGKTKTLVESTMQLLRSATLAGRRCHLLVCAPSDSAADTIATRLKVHLNRMELFRLNGWTRSFAEVPEHLMLHSYTENDLFAIPDGE